MVGSGRDWAIQGGREGIEMRAVEFSEFGFDDLRDCRDITDIMGGIVGDIPRGIEDSGEDFGLESLDDLDV
jgi:hypothetical protein